jgi:hypothetical protein
MRLFVSCGGLARKPLKLYSCFGGMYARADANLQFLYLAGFAARSVSERQNP